MTGYLTAFAIFATVDFGWLVIMGPRLFKPTLGDILLSDVKLAPAVLFYGLYPIGLMLFAVVPATRGGGALAALGLGAGFGFFAYMTYDLTNHATLRNWTATLAAVDVGWGTVLSGITALAAWWTMTRFDA